NNEKMPTPQKIMLPSNVLADFIWNLTQFILVCAVFTRFSQHKSARRCYSSIITIRAIRG
ncbi:MAG: hypothetical protein MUF71_20545, partial [Candidatus Kapabacteria bacterium]|nr:hypothetical protein [Candidatus Kapabacteria bacterium]